MRRRTRPQGARVLLLAFLASTVVHLSLGFPIRAWVEAYLKGASSVPPDVQMVRLSKNAWEANRAIQRRSNKATERRGIQSQADVSDPRSIPKPQEAKKPVVDEKLKGQIVEVPPTADDRPNPDAKFLSKYNSRVEKETVARPDARDSSMSRVTHRLQQKAAPRPSEDGLLSPGISIEGAAGSEFKKAQDSPAAKETKDNAFVLEVPDLQRKDELKLKLDDGPGVGRRIANRIGTEAMRGNSDRFRFEMGKQRAEESAGKDDAKGAGGRSLPTLSALMPNLGTVARINGSPSRDHVDGLPEGDGTFLNAKEFKYATFFYRVRDSVASFWEDLAALEYRRRDPTGNIYGVRDRATLLVIQLNPDGKLASVRIGQTSGVDFLDNVAVEAFRKAEPFPNPPPGIADEDGYIRFNFQFVVTMRARSPLNLFR